MRARRRDENKHTEGAGFAGNRPSHNLSLQSDLGYFLHFVSINRLRYNKHGFGTAEPEIPLHCAANSITKPVWKSLESYQEFLKYNSQIAYE